MCDGMRRLKESEAAEYERKICLVEEYVARSATFYAGVRTATDGREADSAPSEVTQGIPEGMEGNQANLYNLWLDAQAAFKNSKDEKARVTLDWIRNLVKTYHPDMTDKQIKVFLNKLNTEGCGYVADVNTLV